MTEIGIFEVVGLRGLTDTICARERHNVLRERRREGKRVRMVKAMHTTLYDLRYFAIIVFNS